MKSLVVAASVLLTVSSAQCLTWEAFERALHKYAAENLSDPDKPKTPCVCQDGSEYDGMAGVVVHGNTTVGAAATVRVTCFVPLFDAPAGDVIGSEWCNRFQILAK